MIGLRWPFGWSPSSSWPGGRCWPNARRLCPAPLRSVAGCATRPARLGGSSRPQLSATSSTPGYVILVWPTGEPAAAAAGGWPLGAPNLEWATASASSATSAPSSCPPTSLCFGATSSSSRAPTQRRSLARRSSSGDPDPS